MDLNDESINLKNEFNAALKDTISSAWIISFNPSLTAKTRTLVLLEGISLASIEMDLWSISLSTGGTFIVISTVALFL